MTKTLVLKYPHQLSKSFFLCAFLLAMLFTHLTAQPESTYDIQHFTTENGLSENSVTDLSLDTNGTLWLGTQGGLLKFDGTRFKPCTDIDNKVVIKRITNVITTTKGKTYVRFENNASGYGSLNKDYQLQVDPELKRASLVFFAKQSEPVILDPLLKGCPGFTREDITSRLDYIIRNQYGLSVNDHQLYYVFNDRIEWADTKARLMRKSELHCWIQLSTVVDDLFFGFDDSLNVIAAKDGIRLNALPATAGFKKILAGIKPPMRPSLFKNESNSSILASGNQLWLIQKKNGLLDATLIYSGLDFNYPSNVILYDEAHKILFIGTYTSGFYIAKKNNFKTIVFDSVNQVQNNVYAQIQTDDNTVLMPAYSYNPETGKAIAVKRDIPFFSGLYISADRRLWYSTYNDLVYTDMRLQHADSIPFPQHGSRYPAGSFMEDEQQRLWFVNDNSLGYIDSNKIHYVFNDHPYFTKYKINQVFSYNDDTLWIAFSNGIALFDKKKQQLSTRYLLADNYVRHIYRAKDGSIWIGTYGNGFYRYLNGKFIALPLDKYKHLLFVHSFNEDHNGFFWIPTNNGLFQCLKKDLDDYAINPGKDDIYYYYYKKTGKYTSEYNGGVEPASVFYKKHLLLPTLNGVVSFLPDSVQPYLPNDKIWVEQINVDNHPLALNDSFKLAPDFRRLEISISAPYMGDAVNNIVEYNLPENSNSWYPLDASGTIRYNQLTAGNYHLSIRKRTGFGHNHYTYRTISFTVSPYWYQTWIFRLALVLFLVAIIYWAFRWRTAALNRSKLSLQKMVENRTTELKQTVTELHASQQHLSHVNQVQEKAIAVILHDIQSPLYYIATSAQHFNRHLNQLSHQEIHEYATSLSQSAGEINRFANELLEWLIFNQDHQPLTNDVVHLPVLLQEIKSLYDEISKFRQNTIVIETNSVGQIIADRNKLKLVIRNIVDNANKNSTNGQIILSTYYDPSGNVVITITDNGTGMTAEQLEALQQDMPENTQFFQKGKLGFMLVRDFLKLMNGELKIISEKDKGTVVSIILKPASH